MRRLILIIILFFFSCGPTLPISNPFDQSPSPSTSASTSTNKETLRIIALDIGQGDATLVISPSGKTLLIDGGPPGAGFLNILPLFKDWGIDHLDWILASHFDADHIGGLGEVMAGPDQRRGTSDDLGPVEGIIDRGPGTDKKAKVYLDYLKNLPNKHLLAQAGMEISLGHQATARVIVANGNFIDGESVHLNPDEENESCIGLLIEYKNFRYFTAGDLSGGGNPGGYETKDLESIVGDIIGDIDVLHVSHHGSSASTSKAYLQKIHPEAAVISVGRQNDYGHPTQKVLDNLTEMKTQIYRTDLMGTLTIQTNGENFEIAPSLTPIPIHE